MRHQPQIVLDQGIARMLIALREQPQMLFFLFLRQRLRECIVFDVGNEQHQFFDEQRQRCKKSRHEGTPPEVLPRPRPDRVGASLYCMWAPA